MSDLFRQLTQAAQQQQKLQESRNKSSSDKSQNKDNVFIENEDSRKMTNSIEKNVSSQSELASSHSDVTKSKDKKPLAQTEAFDNDLMMQIIKELSITKENYSTTLRLTQEEKKFLDDFIHLDLRRQDLEGHTVSKSKLVRYACTYVLLKHRKPFIIALVAALKEEKKIGLLK